MIYREEKYMKLFLCEAIDQEAFQLLQKEFEIINNIDDIHKCEIIISRNLKMNAEFLERCSSLKLIIIHGSGYDDVDISYLKKHHIYLMNTPGLNSLSVSELIITMMLQLSRQTYQLQYNYQNHLIKEVAPAQYTGCELTNKTFGMIGVGQIALKTAQILRDGFHMKIIGFSRSLTKEKAHQLHIEYCETIDDVLKNSDYVSIGTALTNETYHLITKKQLLLMKPTAFLINTARGAIIKEEDLYDVLKNNIIAGAGLDVLEHEPVAYDYPLINLPNVVYTPHIGATTHEALHRVGMQVYQIAIKYKNGQLCEDILNS